MVGAADGTPPVGFGAIRGRDLVMLVVASGFAYGLVLGAHRLTPTQMLYSGVKVPILLTASSVVCLPNFFVVNTLLGLRADFRVVLRAIAEAQATMAIVLASLAPVTALVYASSSNYRLAIVWNGGMFLTASLASHVHLGRIYAPLIASDPRHRFGKLVWLTLYVFVTIQLAWMLRPFVGSPGLEPSFLRSDLWNNAYVQVGGAVWKVLTRF